jgi:hypothetical protein
MGWHLSRSDPRKVYDSYHQTVAVCQTHQQAALIVQAVNGLPQGTIETFVKLREPERAPDPGAKALTHVTAQAEGCCAKAIGKASLSGALDSLQPWECPKCGTTYWPRQEGPVVSWEARACVMVFKP